MLNWGLRLVLNGGLRFLVLNLSELGQVGLYTTAELGTKVGSEHILNWGLMLVLNIC